MMMDILFFTKAAMNGIQSEHNPASEGIGDIDQNVDIEVKLLVASGQFWSKN